ncbi:MAG TPA: O-antigen ligase family protein, partial [Dongiaceae bacterium]
MILNAPTSTSASTGASDTAGGKGTPTKVLGFREPENPKAAQVTGGREAPGDKEHAVAATAVPIATKDADARPAGLVIWLMCFTSFLGLQLNQSYGTISVVVFLAPWILLMLWRLPQMIRSTFKDYLMLLMPVLAMLSAVWSPDPQATLRLGLQYLATVAIGIAAANLVSRRVVITSLVTTLTLVTLAGLVVSYRTWGMAGLHGTIGLYGSKNFFASSAAIQFIGALYILIHSRNSLFDRLLGLGFLGVALIGVYCGHSAGSTASLGASLAMVFGIQIIRRTGAASVVALTMGLLVGLSALILAGTNVLFADTMQILGKDTSMTGRTELWSTGFAQIQQQPLLGIGYQAFWRIGFPPAEKLWAMF